MEGKFALLVDRTGQLQLLPEGISPHEGTVLLRDLDSELGRRIFALVLKLVGNQVGVHDEWILEEYGCEWNSLTVQPLEVSHYSVTILVVNNRQVRSYTGGNQGDHLLLIVEEPTRTCRLIKKLSCDNTESGSP